MVTIETGDILDSRCKNICQQVNCIGVMGSGLAYQIRQKYPSIFEEYRNILNVYTDKTEVLGKVHKYFAPDGRIIFNIFGQYSFGTDKQYTDYKAVKKAFESIKNHMQPYETLYIPYGIGCGLAGGDWNIVLNIIYNIFCNERIKVVILKLAITEDGCLFSP